MNKKTRGDDGLFADGLCAVIPECAEKNAPAVEPFRMRESATEKIAVNGIGFLLENAMEQRRAAAFEAMRPPQLGCSHIASETLLHADEDLFVHDRLGQKPEMNTNISVATYFDSL